MIAIVIGFALQAATEDSVTSALRARDQLLLNALAPGDRAPWDAALYRPT